jgi:DNA-binding IscR family transcriptional regulator
MTRRSLKGFIPELAEAVGMTPAALYERQRALVRAGLLHGESGRGPGSGVRATPESVAMLLIALLATDSLSETEYQARIVANLKSGKQPCPLTGKKTFASAVASALASEDAAKRIRWLEVERGAKAAGIAYRPRGSDFIVSLAHDLLSERLNPVVSWFGFEGPSRKSALGVRASLDGEVHGTKLDFAALARNLKEAKK